MAAVIALVIWAGVLATPPGRLPIALRALRRSLGMAAGQDEIKPSAAKRLAAFLLVLIALALAMIR